MAEEKTCPCGNTFTDPISEVSPWMHYVNRYTCSIACHNMWILNQGPFRQEGRDPVGPGWMPLILDLHEELFKLDPDYEIMQVKEKFGSLRYYTNRTTEVYGEHVNELFSEEERRAIQSASSSAYWEIWDADREDTETEVPDYKRERYKHLKSASDKLTELGDKLIQDAEDKSAKTCEVCGEAGDVDKTGGWLLTLCEGHSKQRQENKLTFTQLVEEHNDSK